MTRFAAGVLVLAALACAGAVPSRASDKALENVYSKALRGDVGVAVYLPSDYKRSGKRYPVVYFLHGLPAASTSYRGASFLVDALKRTGLQAIIVAPQGARDNDTDPEYIDWGTGRNWETAITRDVVRYVDAHYPTIANRHGRALVGVSAGGYGAVLMALHHLSSFSVIESWSGYFHPTNPDGTQPLPLGSPQKNAHASAHTFVPKLRQMFGRRPTLLAFYVGRNDDTFRDENEQLDRELYRAHVWHVFREYAGGHDPSVWQAHATVWLELALKHLARPSTL